MTWIQELDLIIEVSETASETAEPLPEKCFWSSIQGLFQNKNLMLDNIISTWMFLLLEGAMQL